MRRIKRTGFWIAGLLATAGWTWLLVEQSGQPLPVALALGAIGIVGAFWGDAILFPAPRPSTPPAAPGRMPRDEVLEQAGNWAKDPSATPAPRPVGRPRSVTSRPPGTGAAPRWANPGIPLSKPD